MTTSTPTLPARRAHTVPAGPAVRRHRREVAGWALANGYVLRRDALAALLGARAGAAADPLASAWTAQDVARLMTTDVTRWSHSHGVAEPHELAATLATYLRYLSAHRQFAPGSDDLSTLRRAVAEHRLGDRRSRDRHPAGARRAPVLPIS